LDIRALEDFLCLVEHRNFSRAAERRHSTQSAFSRRIQALEGWAGASLFDRRLSPLGLTPAGQIFIEVAEDILRLAKHGRDEMRNATSHTSQSVSFSVTHSLSLTFFPRWIKTLQQDIGTMSLKLFSYDGEHCRRALAQGDCHFMVCHYTSQMAEDFRASRLRSIVVGHDRFVPVTVPASREGPLVALPGDKDAPIPYLTYTPGSFIGRSVDLFLRAQERPLYLQPCFETSLAQGMKAMVVEGHGVGWLPQATIRQELESGALVRAGDDSWDVRVEIRIFRAATRLSRAAEMLWALLALSKPPITEFL